MQQVLRERLLPVLVVIQTNTMHQQIQTMLLQIFRRIVKVAIRPLHGLLQITTTIRSIFQYIADITKESGLFAPNVTMLPRIMPFSVAFCVIHTATRHQ
jgi:hypothetical protein